MSWKAVYDDSEQKRLFRIYEEAEAAAEAAIGTPEYEQLHDVELDTRDAWLRERHPDWEMRARTKCTRPCALCSQDGATATVS